MFKAFLATVNQAAYFALLMAGHLANGVPIKSWTSVRNTGLSLTQILAQYLAALRVLLIQAVAGMFLDTASGIPLTLFAKSQYQLERTPAQFTSGMLVLTSVASAPAYSFAAGNVTVGTPGPQTSLSRYFSNTESGSLVPGQLQIPGEGQGFTLVRKSTGVSVRIVVAGNSTALTVPPVVESQIIINQSTDAQANATGTAAQIVAAILAQASAAVLVTPTVIGAGTFVPGALAATSLQLGTLVMRFSATQSGAQWNIPTGSPLDMKTSYAGVAVANPAWKNLTWIVTQGADEESNERLKLRCVSRWGTIGVGGTADAMTFWALQIPNGYTSSPVAQVTILSNYLHGTYAGNGCTVVVIGPAGALGVQDVAAVQANFDAPISSMANSGIPGLDTLGKKYPLMVQLEAITATNRTVALVGTVSIYRGRGVTIADVQAAVIAELAVYQGKLRIAQVLYPQQKIAGVIESAPPYGDAIARVDLSAMPNSIAMEPLQYPILDASGLVYQMVDV